MQRIILALVMLGAVCIDLSAQSSATFHVFPQLADGLQDAASGYISTVIATNTSNATSTCTMHYYGNGLASRFTTNTFTLPASGSFIQFYSIVQSGVVNLLATGYATMSCTQPVAAGVGYLYLSTTGTILSAASVFSSPPATRAQFIVSSGSRLALAIANDTDAPATYQLTLLNTTGQTVGTASVPVSPRSNKPTFVDEVITVPQRFDGAVQISSAAASPFSVMGLVFIGNVFLSVPAAILQ